MRTRSWYRTWSTTAPIFSWASAVSSAGGQLRGYHALPSADGLPDHGVPGGKKLYDDMIAYPDIAEDMFRFSTTGGSLKQRMLEHFPDYGCRKVLDHQLRFRYP
jgi:hypothetical protein